ncbi:hypothetical protein D3C86_1586560 [compost metagenome]
MQLLQVAVLIPHEFLRVDQVRPRVFALKRSRFLLTVVHFKHLRPFRPWVIRLARFWRLRHNLKLRHALAFMTNGSTYAVCSGVTTADYDNIFAFGRNEFTISVFGIEQALRIFAEEFHR